MRADDNLMFWRSRWSLRRSTAEFRHHLFQVTAESVFQPHLEIFQNLTLDLGARCSKLLEITWNYLKLFWPQKHGGGCDGVGGGPDQARLTFCWLLAAPQGKHGKHASREKAHTALTVALPSLDLNLTRRPRPHCTAEVEGSGCAERTNTLPNASFSPHRTLAAQRTLGIAPRGGALATLWGTRTDWTSLQEPCRPGGHCNDKRTTIEAARSTSDVSLGAALKSAQTREISASACSTDRCGSPPPLRNRKTCQGAETSPAPSNGRPPNLSSSSQQCFRKRSPLAAAASSTRSNIPDLVWKHHPAAVTRPNYEDVSATLLLLEASFQ